MAAVSLRRRLLALVLGGTAAVWLAVAAFGYFQARHEAEELLDAHLAQFAALLAVHVGDDADEIEVEHAPPTHRYARKVAFQMWLRGSVLGLHSVNAPDERLSPAEQGFSDARHGGERWRVYSLRVPEGGTLIQVGERSEAREEIMDALGRHLVLALAAALPLLAAAVWIGIGRALLPLDALRDQLARRRAEDRAPLDAGGAPVEIAPLVAELNLLFGRIQDAIERERRLTADAAHELRTPLAALSTQAQVARAAHTPAVREEALDALVSAAERTARLVEQMLTLARLEAGALELRRAPLELRALVRAALAEAGPRAIANDLDVALEEGDEARIEGDAALLEVLVRNLADNAVRYAPRGGTVRAAVRRVAEGVALEFANSGRALPAEELERLGERFYRAGFEAESGSGLGLSIVRRIAELHEGVVRFAPGADGLGLAVTVALPERPC